MPEGTLRLYGSIQVDIRVNSQGRIAITTTTRHRVQPKTFAKTGVGVLGAAIAATAAVTFGSAGIAQACDSNQAGGESVYTSCAYVQNNTGYTVYSSGGNLGAQAIATGATFGDAVPMGSEYNFTFTMPENANYAASTWTLNYNYPASGDLTAVFGWTSGSASSPASFGTPTTTEVYSGPTEILTLGGASHSLKSYNYGCGQCTFGSVGQVNYASETPGNRRGTVIVVNEMKQKIWNPRTNPLRGVAEKPTAPVSAVAAVSPVSSTLPAQPQSVAKTATPHRAASPRAAVTASGSAPSA